MIKKRIEFFSQYAGIATVCVEWLSLLLYYLSMPQYFGGKYPVSYFATLPQTKLIFSTCYVLASIFFWIFVRHHLGKYYQQPIKIFELSLFLFILLALVPFDPDNLVSSMVHIALGYASAVTFAIGMYLTAKSSKSKLVYRITIIAILISVLFLVIFALLPKESTLIFAFEAGSWLVVQLWIMWISYYIYYKNKKLRS